MFQPINLDLATPHAVQLFIRLVIDAHLSDVHAVLRLPRPEVEITHACNFSIVATLMNVISGASVVL